MAKILVVGESCKDIFVYCDAIRLAPDVPVPVLRTIHIDENPGMAANVHRNITSRLKDSSLYTNPEWDRITKTRYMHDKSNHMFFRVDSASDILQVDLGKLDLSSELIVVSDYNKGFLTEADIQWICENHPNVFLDTKKVLGEWASEAKFIKINDFEFKNSEDKISESLKSKIIHTVGQSGCNFQGENFPVTKHEIRDTSGAGDSFMAALAVEYLNSQDIISSIKCANLAASEVVQHRGVGII
jgi:D-beta-D-heptose 7-phosphate kinase/D-beta-D-heptose 1-phosphate adenosyltransferase